MKIRFFLLLLPSKEAAVQVQEMQHYASQFLVSSKPRSEAPAHLSLCSFSMAPGREGVVVESISKILSGLPFLNLITSGVETFSQMGTVYLSVEPREKYGIFQGQVIQALKDQVPGMKRNMSIASVPHLTIARGLNVDEAENLARHLQQRFSERQFGAERIVLMGQTNGKMRPSFGWDLPAGI